MAINKDFEKLKRKSPIRIKSYTPSQGISRKLYKSKYGHEIIKILSIAATTLRYYGK